MIKSLSKETKATVRSVALILCTTFQPFFARFSKQKIRNNKGIKIDTQSKFLLLSLVRGQKRRKSQDQKVTLHFSPLWIVYREQ